VRSFSTSVTPAFFKRRASMAKHHLSGEYPVCSGISVTRSSSSVIVSLNDPSFHLPKFNMSHQQDFRSVAPFQKEFHSSGVILYKGSCSVALRFCRNCLINLLVYSSTSSGGVIGAVQHHTYCWAYPYPYPYPSHILLKSNFHESSICCLLKFCFISLVAQLL
jgi:hypothetical protein